MLLGFISLLLTVGTKYIAKICVPAKYGERMLPCKSIYEEEGHKGKGKGGGGGGDNGDDDRRKLLSFAGDVVWHRVLAAAAGGDDYCGKKVIIIFHHSVKMLNTTDCNSHLECVMDGV